MNIDGLNERIKEIKERTEKEINNLKRKYASEHSTVVKGDIVTDHIGSVKVERITVHYGYNRDTEPSCIYYGQEITKKGVPFKNESKRSVFQINLKKV